MVNRDEEGENNRDFNVKDPDPTREAFFSDMGNIENEIASEAIELVKHALSLLESQFYDDSIEIFRQAIGLYTQINKESEVEAIKGKISEIYLLREENFKKRELETKDIFENNQREIISEQDEENLYLLTELCSDDLFEIISKEQLTAANRKKWIKQAAQALKYLHDRRVVHRDIKPENMFICGGNLKLIDFGFATRLRKNQKIKGLIGTPTYMAPEILSKQLYDTLVDLWSLGVVIYVMFFARYPFDRPLGYRLKNQIISGRYIFPADVAVSNAAKDLIIGLLQTDPKQRITIEQVLEHPYLN